LNLGLAGIGPGANDFPAEGPSARVGFPPEGPSARPMGVPPLATIGVAPAVPVNGAVAAAMVQEQLLSAGTQIVSVKKSRAGWWVFFLLLVGGGGGAVWWFYLRPQATEIDSPLPASQASSVITDGKKDAGVPPKKEPKKQPDKAQVPEPPPDQKTAPPDKTPSKVVDEGKNPPDKTQPQPPSMAGPPPRTVKESLTLLAQARAAEAKMNWVDAKTLYDRVSKGKWNKAEGLVGLSSVSWNKGEIDSAITYGKQALASGGGDPARLVLARSYVKKGQFDLAIALYREVLKKQPKNKEALAGLQEAEKQKKSPQH
jgi:hypothetical protein